MVKKIILVAAMTVGTLSVSAQSFGGFDNQPGRQEFQPYGQGLPLPWPFPWAKECPVLWSKLSGRYVILDSQYQEEMELKISILTQDGMKLMRISRYNHSGALVAEGFAWLTQNQKSVGVRLRPLGKKAHPMYAYIKLYHGTDSLSCEMNSLVPILSLVEKRPEMTTEIQYRLVRRPIQQ